MPLRRSTWVGPRSPLSEEIIPVAQDKIGAGGNLEPRTPVDLEREICYLAHLPFRPAYLGIFMYSSGVHFQNWHTSSYVSITAILVLAPGTEVASADLEIFDVYSSIAPYLPSTLARNSGLAPTTAGNRFLVFNS